MRIPPNPATMLRPARSAAALAALSLAACSAPAARTAPIADSSPPSAERAASPVAAEFDLLILGGEVLDGTGAASVRADVGIRRDRIAEIGPLAGRTARDTIRAAGLVVSPGWIDLLGHSEYRLLADGRALSKITQGITSEVTGEVSSVVPVNARTMAELDEEYRPLVDWTDLDGYFRSLERRGTAINLATFVTAGSVRRAVMGDEDRASTPAELAEMRRHVDAAMRQGAVGLSAGLPYAPASFARRDEIVALAEMAGRHGGGYATHLRSEGANLLPAVREAIEIGQRGGTWVHIHHLKASGRANWGRVRDAVALIDGARGTGVDVTADVYPYVASNTDLDAIVPAWAHAGGVEALVARLRDPAVRARIRGELSPDGDYGAVGASAGGPSGVMISDVHVDSLKRYEGMRLDAVARMRRQDPIEAMLDLLVADRSRTGAIFFAMSEGDVETALRQPWSGVGTDAGARAADTTVVGKPHPRAYGTFPRILCRYVRERRIITLPDAIRRFTSLPAARVGLRDRGVLRVGAFADVTVFDPRTVCDRATFEQPIQTAVGIPHVVVNGVPVLRDGRPTGARPGRGLRRETVN